MATISAADANYAENVGQAKAQLKLRSSRHTSGLEFRPSVRLRSGIIAVENCAHDHATVTLTYGCQLVAPIYIESTSLLYIGYRFWGIPPRS